SIWDDGTMYGLVKDHCDNLRNVDVSIVEDIPLHQNVSFLTPSEPYWTYHMKGRLRRDPSKVARPCGVMEPTAKVSC
ncbi:hypothetical protein KI387_042793, partial [Taxus chinensis]